jgi:ABC-type sugar transport system substrate-binding protein
MQRFMTISTVLFCATAAGVLTLTGCTALPHDPKETYTLIIADTQLPYWQTMLSGLKSAAAELKVRAEMFERQLKGADLCEAGPDFF